MPYFKSDTDIRFLTDEDLANGWGDSLPEGFAAITDAEAQALLPTPTAADLVKQQINDLESSITPRRMREAVLGTDGGWLANLDAQIADLRKQLT